MSIQLMGIVTYQQHGRKKEEHIPVQVKIEQSDRYYLRTKCHRKSNR